MVLNAFGRVQELDLTERAAFVLFYEEAKAKIFDEYYQGPWHVNKFVR